MSLYLSRKKLLISQIPYICDDIKEIIGTNLVSIPKPIIKTNFVISNEIKKNNDLFNKIKKNKKKKPLEINNINTLCQRKLVEEFD